MQGLIDYLFIHGDYKEQLPKLKENLVPEESDGAPIQISLVICDPPFGCKKDDEWDKPEDKWGQKEFEEAFKFIEKVNEVSFKK